MDTWMVKRDGREIAVCDVTTIRRWAQEGHLRPDDLIFSPTVQAWISPDHVAEIQDVDVRSADHSARSDTELVVRQGVAEYRVASLDVLRVWAREGRIQPDSTVYADKVQRWVFVKSLPGVEFPASGAPPVRVVDVATNYRQMVVWFGVQLLISIWLSVADSLQFLVVPVLVLSIVALSYYAHQTARSLGSPYAIVWAVGMLAPCINLLILLALSSRANDVCRANGIRVGLMGPEL